MNRQYCKDCHWWVDTAELFGESIMAPPIVEGKHLPLRIGTCHVTHHFESTKETDWCGEFQAKEIGEN